MVTMGPASVSVKRTHCFMYLLVPIRPLGVRPIDWSMLVVVSCVIPVRRLRAFYVPTYYQALCSDAKEGGFIFCTW